MASFSSFKAFGAELDKVTRKLDRDGRRRIARQMAEEAERIAVKEARADLGDDAAFSGWPGDDRALSSLKIKPGRNDAHWLFPTRKSGGPWKVAEVGRNRSVSRFGGATGRGGGALFQGPGINRQTGVTSLSKSGNVIVRRSKGKKWSGYTDPKRTASRARERMERELPKIAEREYRKVLVKHFDVTGS